MKQTFSCVQRHQRFETIVHLKISNFLKNMEAATRYSPTLAGDGAGAWKETQQLLLQDFKTRLGFADMVVVKPLPYPSEHLIS